MLAFSFLVAIHSWFEAAKATQYNPPFLGLYLVAFSTPLTPPFPGTEGVPSLLAHHAAPPRHDAPCVTRQVRRQRLRGSHELRRVGAGRGALRAPGRRRLRAVGTSTEPRGSWRRSGSEVRVTPTISGGGWSPRDTVLVLNSAEAEALFQSRLLRRLCSGVCKKELGRCVASLGRMHIPRHSIYGIISVQ